MNHLYIPILTTFLLLGCTSSNSDQMKEEQKNMIENYVSAYNSFDIQGMFSDMSEDVVFENVSGGEVEMRLEGLNAFKEQAEAAKSYFSERQQTITNWRFDEDRVEIEVSYSAILAMDLPNGMKTGDTLNLNGKSTFHFENNKITRVVDES